MNETDEIRELRQKLETQSAQINSLEGASQKAKQLSAIVSLIAAVAGMLVGFFTFSFKVRDELKAWEIVKSQHFRETSGGDQYDHRGLEGHDIQKALTQLGYPTADEVVVKAELPAAVDLTQFVKNSDLVDYVNSSALPNFDDFIKIDEEFRLKLRDTATDHYVNMWTDGGLVYLTAQPTGQFFEVVK